MELARRPNGDELLKSGEMTALLGRLKAISHRHDLATVIACAFDHRTRMLPFIFADMKLLPAGVRSIGAAMLAAGFDKTRIVLQQWNKNFRPSQARLDGRLPDIFMLSSMALHIDPARQMVRDLFKIEPEKRPLIIAGGSSCIYMPWELFSDDPSDRWAVDVAVTGEEFVLLSLLEVLLAERRGGEPIRQTFLRARDAGLLDGIPGLVYARGPADGISEVLVDTGIQRLLGDMDELPHPSPALSIFERPSRLATITSRPMTSSQLRQHALGVTLVMTWGCKFSCHYCPIPAYNQRQLRYKSGRRIVDEMTRIRREHGISFFFGSDDNFFNNHQNTLHIIETMAQAQIDGQAFRHKVRWGSETTVHDLLAMQDHLRLARRAGLRAIWLGVEDMTATLVKKGQSPEKTVEAFNILLQRGIIANPMMMHFDEQPLWTPGKPLGLLNQVGILKKARAVSLQVLMITPSAGSRVYEETFRSGMVIDSAAGQKVESRMYDGNYVITTLDPRPWRKQLNIMLAYLSFYNPLRFFWILITGFRRRLYLAELALQIVGIWGLYSTIGRTFGWFLRLIKGPVRKLTQPLRSHIPMRSPDGTPAAHDLPPEPAPKEQPV
ncbi:MAG: radical SAM protein [Planctomycetes bacterium]|nr:radical SAM protein [Planctomycetota bacterium]